MIQHIDVEQVLSKFRRWLEETLTDAEDLEVEDGRPLFSKLGGLDAASGNGDSRDVGLVRLVEEFTALRHELKLQTKSGRGLQEQTETVLGAMRDAVEALRAVEAKGVRAVRDAGKSLAEALAEFDEALDRGYAEIEKAVNRRRTGGRSSGGKNSAIVSELDRHYAGSPSFRRAIVHSYYEEVRELIEKTQADEEQAVLNALIEGYSLVRRRLIRALRAEEIEPIECVGLPLDPETMTVVDVADDPESPPGLVVEEIRRGYTWRGRLLRYAEVRVVKSRDESEYDPDDSDRDSFDEDDLAS